MLSISRKRSILLLVASVVFVLDRLTKAGIMRKLAAFETVPVIPNFFDIVHVRNKGAAFGILAMADSSFRMPVLLLSTAVAIGLLLYFIKIVREQDTLTLVALALIIGGAIGNLYDRIFYGHVVDFIDWYVGVHHWPAFNIADSGITVGVILLGVELILRGRGLGPDQGA
ncbi:MAG TPA: signal peptidase II [Nitrospirota bacterium]